MPVLNSYLACVCCLFDACLMHVSHRTEFDDVGRPLDTILDRSSLLLMI